MGKLLLSRRGTATALVAGLTAALLTGCASTDREVQKLHARSAYEQALKNLSDHRVSLGLASLQQAIALDPGDPIYRNALGVVQLDLRKPAEAQEQFQKAIELDPEYAEAHHNLGLSYAEQGRFDEAIQAYRKALSFPTYTTPEVAYNNMGNAYFALGKLPEAQESYLAALRLDPKLASAHYGLGMILSRQGKAEEAKASFRTARDINPAAPFGLAASQALKALGEPGQGGEVTR